MAAVTLPTFTGLRANPSAATARPVTRPITATATTARFSPKASLKKLSAAAAAAAASAVIAGNALAYDVLLGADDGSLVFVPENFEVPSGEKIVFKNNAGFPHNVVFEEDGVPAGVDVAKISMADDETLNAVGEVYTVTLTEKGTYSFYCTPHVGAGMVGKVTVK